MYVYVYVYVYGDEYVYVKEQCVFICTSTMCMNRYNVPIYVYVDADV